MAELHSARIFTSTYLVCAREGVMKMHDEFDPRFQPDPIEHPNSNHEEQ